MCDVVVVPTTFIIAVVSNCSVLINIVCTDANPSQHLLLYTFHCFSPFLVCVLHH